MNDPASLIQLVASDPDNKIRDLGVEIGKLYTDHGLPVDMAFQRIDADKYTKRVMLFGTCTWLIQHKRNSGASDKAIERQRKANLEAMVQFDRTGEVGLY